MGADLSRVRFDALRDHSGVVMQQGRLLLDADWNELVAIVDRRLRAGAADLGSSGAATGIAGTAVVPRTTPDGFKLTAPAGTLTIGRGRMYVDGLLAENHGLTDGAYDALLAEPARTQDTPYGSQPYWPTPTPLPTTGTHLVYLDVWPREVTTLEDPELLETAVGVDTTARTQTVWQVRVHGADTPGITCSTKDADVPGWRDVIAPSAGRLTTGTVPVNASDDPCTLPPTGDYRGLENQTYRVEVHQGGSVGTATFKWSRDNGSVAMAVTEVVSSTRLRPASLGRDQVLGLRTNDWVEILDDNRELDQRSGEIRKIVVHDEDGTISFTPALPADLPTTTAQATARHLRVRRWDQSGQVKSATGTNLDNLDAVGSTGVITVPAGAAVVLEHGITVALEATGGTFRAGDHWVFVARTMTAAVQQLTKAPPLGIHHHYARLGVLAPPNVTSDCRTLWPPVAEESDCGDCTVCVTPESHASGAMTIQMAITKVRPTGGTVCMATGLYRLDDGAVQIDGCTSVRLRGQGPRTILLAREGAVSVARSAFVTLEDFTVIAHGPLPSVRMTSTAEVTARRLTMLVSDKDDNPVAAFELGGLALMTHLLDNDVLSPIGVTAGLGKEPTLTAGLEIARNVLVSSLSGVLLDGSVAYLLDNVIRDNTVLRSRDVGIRTLGVLAAGGSFEIRDNDVYSDGGTGVDVATSGFTVRDNVVNGSARDAKATADGIVVRPSQFAKLRGRTSITGNQVRDFGGAGIAVRAAVDDLVLSHNLVERTAEGIVVQDRGRAQVASVTHNVVRDVGSQESDNATSAVGIQVVGAAHAVVEANTVLGVGAARSAGDQAVGVRLLGCEESRVLGNGVENVGMVEGAGQTTGIQVGGFFSRTIIEANDARRRSADEDDRAATGWTGLVVGEAVSTPRIDVGGPLRETVNAGLLGGYVALHGETTSYLIGAMTAFTHRGRDISATVANNTVTGGGEVAAASVTVLGDVVLANNQCRQLIDTDHPAVELRASSATVNANRARGGTPSMRLDVAGDRLAVLGNVTSGGIDAPGGLDPRWQPLNIDGVL